MVKFGDQAIYYVAFFLISGTSIEEVSAAAPETLAAHLKRSKELQQQGKLLMAGALLHNAPGEPLTTMGVFPSREAAEVYAAGALNPAVTDIP